MTKTTTEVQESKFEMRKLKSKDVFAMSKILKKMDIKGQINSKGKTPEQFGQEFFMTILENIGQAENEFNDFLGDLIGMTGEQFAYLDFEDVFEVLEQFKKQDGIKRFLQLMK